MEGIANPFVTKPAYQGFDADHVVWNQFINGEEIADGCELNTQQWLKPTGFDFMVQRIWSNVSARGGHSPCVPTLPGEVYFNAAPILTDTLAVPGTLIPPSGGVTKSVRIPSGTSKAVEVDFFSDAPAPQWNAMAVELPLFGSPPRLSFQWDVQSCANGRCSTTGQNGDKRTLTISVANVDAGTGAQLPAEGFVVASYDNATPPKNTFFWVGLVSNE
jgi:hypothetical protein